MIKIIKQGTRTQETCDKCGCVFSYEAEDIQYGTNELLGTKHGYKQYVRCPQCNDEIFISQTR